MKTQMPRYQLQGTEEEMGGSAPAQHPPLGVARVPLAWGWLFILEQSTVHSRTLREEYKWGCGVGSFPSSETEKMRRACQMGDPDPTLNSSSSSFLNYLFNQAD